MARIPAALPIGSQLSGFPPTGWNLAVHHNSRFGSLFDAGFELHPAPQPPRLHGRGQTDDQLVLFAGLDFVQVRRDARLARVHHL